ncbi:MAG: HigA family addiction module antidote protein [Chloroflexi bacterium]|nr:HigA family addiction module antidote protein [Chloroflexota bacterium]
MIPEIRPPASPGQILLEEFLEPLGLTQVAAAHQMGMPINRVNELVRGKRGITAATALRLSELLGTSPEFWINLQTACDLYAARKRQESVPA